MTSRTALAWLAAVLMAAGCASTPPSAPEPVLDDEASMSSSPPAPLIEYPPIEPVEIPPAEPPPAPPAPASSQPAATPAPVLAMPSPSVAPAPAPVIVPRASNDELAMDALLADIARYGTLGREELKREFTQVSRELARDRGVANRIRLAVLYTYGQTPQNDQLAIVQLELAMRDGNGASPMQKGLAAALYAQVSERVRALREEQRKSEAAIDKLNRLRDLERSSILDRIRGGGSGGSGGGSGGGGGGGGG